MKTSLFFIPFLLISCAAEQPRKVPKTQPQTPQKANPKAEPQKASILIRKMGKQGVVIGRFTEKQASNINPLDDHPDTKNQKLIQKRIGKSQTLLALSPIRISPSIPPLLTGRSRVECGELIVEMKGKSEEGLFLRADHPLQPNPVVSVKTHSEYKKKIRDELGLRRIEALQVFRADLDGDGESERIHIVNGPPESNDYAYIIVESKGEYSKIGYKQGVAKARPKDAPFNVSLLAITDLNGDGKMEIVVAFDDNPIHFHKWIVYSWTGSLTPLLDYTWGERDCYPNMADWPDSI